MTSVVFFMSLLVGAVVQVTWPPILLLGHVKPPILLAIVIYYALNRNVGLMLCAAMGAGFLQDATSLIPLGYSPTVFVLIGWLCSRYKDLVVVESTMTPLVFGGLSGGAMFLMLSFLLAQGGQVHFVLRRMLLQLAGAGSLGMVSAVVVFRLMGGLERRVGNVRTVDEII